MTDVVERWPAERATAWPERIGPIRGFNFLPRTAVNAIEMWQADTFDPHTIAQELGWAGRFGYNALRVFLPFIVWEHDPDKLIDRPDRLLELAAGAGLHAMPVLFDDCAFGKREPSLGPQLRAYAQGVVDRFGRHERVAVWDVYNEPGNGGMGRRTQPLVEAAFGWVREARSAQPLTSAPWIYFEAPPSRRLFELSDVLSFHVYEGPRLTETVVEVAVAHEGPMLCTEWLHRAHGNGFAEILPVFERFRVGWYHWGLVTGRSQTHLPWGGLLEGDDPDLWQHDVLRPDGTPYDPGELVELGRHVARAGR